MTKKRRRGGSRPKHSGSAQAGQGQAALSGGGSSRAAAGTKGRTGSSQGGQRAGSRRPADRRGRAAAERIRRAPVTVPHPPVFRSLARGLAVVGNSPVLLLTTFLGVLSLWGIYSSAGLIRVTSPGVMAQLMAVPPVHAAFDANFFGVGTVVFAPATTITLTAGLLVLRSALVAFVISLVLEYFEGEPPRLEGGTGGVVRAALVRAARSIRLVLTVEAFFLVVMLGLPILLGPLIGPLAIAITFVAPAFFLVYAPVIAVREAPGLRQSLRLAFRASRLRGPQHVLLVFTYVMATLFLFISTQGRPDTPVTATVQVWAYALFINVLHLSVLAAIVYRWLAVRDIVLEMAAEAPARPERTRPRGLRS